MKQKAWNKSVALDLHIVIRKKALSINYMDLAFPSYNNYLKTTDSHNIFV